MELWLLAGEGAATDAQLEQLSRTIADDPAARDVLLQISRHQGWLAYNAASVKLPAAISALAPAPARERAAPRRGRLARWRSAAADLFAPRQVGLRAALALGLAGGVGFMAAGWRQADFPDFSPQAIAAPIQATMVSATGCVWGPGNALPQNGRPAQHDRFAGGDSLQLLEGIAELEIAYADADVSLQMEGPASVVLTARGAPNMSFGKINFAVDPAAALPYPVETSFGRVLADPGAEVGVVAFGSKAEIHCFAGRATVESPWLEASGAEAARVALAAGESLRFEDVGGGALQVTRSVADRQQFTPQVSLRADFLSVTPDYVRDVVQSRPVAYWRFEDADASVVKNEMGPSHACAVKGEVQRIGPDGNRAVELGMGASPGSIVSAESWDNVLAGDFAIELWMKPSHYHVGSMVGFVGEFDPALQRNKHGVLLETCSPSTPSPWSRLRELRFLHRSELTADATDGVSCFSGREYENRRWQHVVAVKEGDELRLYLDGRLVQTASDPRPTPAGLHLVIGQLYTETVERFFIGQLDEVAIYDHALSNEQIRRRHELLRPAKPVSGAVL